MRNYELTVVLPGGSTAAKKKTFREKIEKIVKVFKGKIGKIDDWGELDLAFPIANSNTGIYLHFPLELDTNGAILIVEKLRLEEGLLRYLLVRKEK